MDYVTMPDRLLKQCNPVQRQLLEAASAPLSYYIPRDPDVPIKGLVSE